MVKSKVKIEIKNVVTASILEISGIDLKIIEEKTALNKKITMTSA